MYILKSLSNLYFEIQTFNLKLMQFNCLACEDTLCAAQEFTILIILHSMCWKESLHSFSCSKKSNIYRCFFQGRTQNWEKSNIKADQSQKVLHKNLLSAKTYFATKWPILWKTCSLVSCDVTIERLLRWSCLDKDVDTYDTQGLSWLWTHCSSLVTRFCFPFWIYRIREQGSYIWSHRRSKCKESHLSKHMQKF